MAMTVDKIQKNIKNRVDLMLNSCGFGDCEVTYDTSMGFGIVTITYDSAYIDGVSAQQLIWAVQGRVITIIVEATGSTAGYNSPTNASTYSQFIELH